MPPAPCAPPPPAIALGPPCQVRRPVDGSRAAGRGSRIDGLLVRCAGSPTLELDQRFLLRFEPGDTTVALRLDHIAICIYTGNLERYADRLCAQLPAPTRRRPEVADEDEDGIILVDVQDRVAGVHVALVAPLSHGIDPGGQAARILAATGTEGLQHLAFTVSDMSSVLHALHREGLRFFGAEANRPGGPLSSCATVIVGCARRSVRPCSVNFLSSWWSAQGSRGCTLRISKRFTRGTTGSTGRQRRSDSPPIRPNRSSSPTRTSSSRRPIAPKAIRSGPTRGSPRSNKRRVRAR